MRFGGRNISRHRVKSVVGQHPDMRIVAAFGIPSAEVECEDELKNNTVLADGVEQSHEAICEFISNNAPYFVPCYMEFVAELPCTPNKRSRNTSCVNQALLTLPGAYANRTTRQVNKLTCRSP